MRNAKNMPKHRKIDLRTSQAAVRQRNLTDVFDRRNSTRHFRIGAYGIRVLKLILGGLESLDCRGKACSFPRKEKETRNMTRHAGGDPSFDDHVGLCHVTLF